MLPHRPDGHRHAGVQPGAEQRGVARAELRMLVGMALVALTRCGADPARRAIVSSALRGSYVRRDRRMGRDIFTGRAGQGVALA